MAKGKKFNLTMLGLILITIIGMLVGFILISIIGIIKEPIGYAIRLQSQEIPQSTVGVLFFTINNYGYQKITNITIENYIKNQTNLGKDTQTFNDLVFLGKGVGAYTFNTQNLPKGDYIVESTAKYLDSNGTMQNKSLSLGFKVI